MMSSVFEGFAIDGKDSRRLWVDDVVMCFEKMVKKPVLRSEILRIFQAIEDSQFQFNT